MIQNKLKCKGAIPCILKNTFAFNKRHSCRTFHLDSINNKNNNESGFEQNGESTTIPTKNSEFFDYSIE